ncbi:MAG: hypothetical protein E7604_04010 [Ruminococcaceae bacterium]|nr:hypothetical protein [Oscillospiraceae bacterium]
MKKVSAALLAACILAGTLISCGSDTNTPAVTDAATDAATEAVTEAAAKPEIPSADYGGAEVLIQGFQVYYAPALYAEEENGDAYNDVLYQRIARTEEYLNIDITFDDSIGVGDTAKVVQNSVAAADDAIQLVLSHDMTGNSKLVSQNLCYDMLAIASVDLNRDYWKLSAYDMLAVNGHIYLTKPAFIIPSVGCFTFNKRMIAEFDMEEPYQDVIDGKWTLDKMAEMSKIVTKDVNGDGTMDENDIYGFSCGADWQLNAFIFSLGSSVTTLDENGKIVLALDTPHTSEVYTALHEFFNNSGDAWLGGGIDMKTDRCLFSQYTTKSLDNLRDCEVEYGIVPYPKWDEAQERYNGYDISSFISIPSSVADPEMVGQTLEMLNFYSRELVLPTYYDISLNTKSVRDEESVKMLDIIFNDIYCDAGRTYFGLDNNAMFSLVYSVSHHVYQKKTGDIASHFAKNQKGAQKCIDNFYKAVESNE